MKLLTNRIIMFLIAIMCFCSFAYACYAQIYQHAMPCPLCIVERIVIVAIGIFAFLFALHNPQNFLIRIYGVILLCIELLGLKIAIRHVELINTPIDELPQQCTLPINILFKKLPLNRFLHTILSGDAECAKMNWTILGISAPTLVLLFFVALLVLTCIIVFRKKETKKKFYIN